MACYAGFKPSKCRSDCDRLICAHGWLPIGGHIHRALRNLRLNPPRRFDLNQIFFA